MPDNPVYGIMVFNKGHGFHEPRHQRTRDIEEIKWMQKYIQGIDWKPWERKEEKKDEEKK